MILLDTQGLGYELVCPYKKVALAGTPARPERGNPKVGLFLAQEGSLMSGLAV